MRNAFVLNEDFLDMISALQSEGVEFDEAWDSRQTHIIDGHALPVIGLAELLKNKHASGGPQDLVDAAELEARVNEKTARHFAPFQNPPLCTASS